MAYKVRLRADGWLLESPDGEVVSEGNPYPFDDSDEDLWRSIAQHARQQQGGINMGIVAAGMGLDVIDERR